jgi:hypothetical protein
LLRFPIVDVKDWIRQGWVERMDQDIVNGVAGMDNGWIVLGMADRLLHGLKRMARKVRKWRRFTGIVIKVGGG